MRDGRVKWRDNVVIGNKETKKENKMRKWSGKNREGKQVEKVEQKVAS